jgi:hypothetical protein
MNEIQDTPHENMSVTHKLVWAGTVVFVLFLFFTMVRRPLSFALFIGTSLLLVLFMSDVLNRGFIAALTCRLVSGKCFGCCRPNAGEVEGSRKRLAEST